MEILGWIEDIQNSRMESCVSAFLIAECSASQVEFICFTVQAVNKGEILKIEDNRQIKC